VNDDDRQIAAAMLDQAKSPPMPSFVSRSVVKTMQMFTAAPSRLKYETDAPSLDPANALRPILLFKVNRGVTK
jgi:hypothetical protein